MVVRFGGADYAMHINPQAVLNNKLQHVHLNFLRFVSGASKQIPNVVLLHKFKAAPVACHLLRLVSRILNS